MIDAATFRSVLGRFASGVTVLTTRDAAGRDHGMTASAVCSVSLEPPLVLVCVEQRAAIHAPLAAASHFALNILSASQEAIARRFAENGTDRFDGLAWTRGTTGVVLLEGILAHVECTVTHRYPGGDHSIVVGEVLEAAAGTGLPLLYYRGGYAQLER